MSNKEIDRDVLEAISKSPKYYLEIYNCCPYSLQTIDESIKRLIRRKLITLGENKKYERVNP